MPRRAMKPSKAVSKRFKVTKTGKLKRHHGFTSHLMSSRSANRRRKLRRSDIVPESHGRRLRKLMGVFKSPGKTATAKAKARREAAAAAVAVAATAAEGAVVAQA
jgi:large subunit ribosomal protein L35